MYDYLFEVNRKIWVVAESEEDAFRVALRSTWDADYAHENSASNAYSQPEITVIAHNKRDK